MYGIYALDLDTGHLYVSPANSLQEVQEALQREQHSGLVPFSANAQWEGSYHYYPIHSQETENDAEKRIFLMLSRQYGSTNICMRYTFRELLARGTWSPGLRMAVASDQDLTQSVHSSATEKEHVFSISI